MHLYQAALFYSALLTQPMNIPLPLRAPLIASSIFGISLAVAWQLPGTAVAALLGWIAACSFAYLVSPQRGEAPQRENLVIIGTSFLGGIIVVWSGFHWLASTISQFSGLPLIVSYPVFALFVGVVALQFPLTVLLMRMIPAWTHRSALALPLAWTTLELVAIRIFPWYLGHTQLAFLPFAQIAEIGGATLISFLMMWSASALVAYRTDKSLLVVLPPVLTVIVATLFGVLRLREFDLRDLGKTHLQQRVALVQGNISLEEKHAAEQGSENFLHYLSLTAPHVDERTIYLWPETALTNWIPATLGNRTKHHDLKQLPHGVAGLIGALSFESEKRFFNSALALFPDGTMPAPYHKQILMPFGEYTPGTDDSWLSTVVPGFLQRFLREMNATAPNFTPGSTATVFSYPLTRPTAEGGPYSAKLSPLICYEDLVSEPAREATLMGAELLTAITNDAWFGKSVAAKQHHVVASFRAIENRRYLLRVTNTGFTGVIAPTGETTDMLPEWTPGTLLAKVYLIGYKTIYTQVLGGAHVWFLIGVALLMIVRLITGNRNSRAA
jgi:apolipoprotein N-acyltransferase